MQLLARGKRHNMIQESSVNLKLIKYVQLFEVML